MILCGIGLPLPEEVILVAAGYTAYLGHAGIPDLVATCAGAILLGDLLPFSLGRLFGPKLLRIRLVRKWISRQRLARFDLWFRKHGRLTIFVARFLTGIRVPAFFAAGSMRMSFPRFLLMDCLGLSIGTPAFVGLGYFGGERIETVIRWVQRAERYVLWGLCAGVIVGAATWYWVHRRRARALLGGERRETFVGPPEIEVAFEPSDEAETSASGPVHSETEDRESGDPEPENDGSAEIDARPDGAGGGDLGDSAADREGERDREGPPGEEPRSAGAEVVNPALEPPQVGG